MKATAAVDPASTRTSAGQLPGGLQKGAKCWSRERTSADGLGPRHPLDETSYLTSFFSVAIPGRTKRRSPSRRRETGFDSRPQRSLQPGSERNPGEVFRPRHQERRHSDFYSGLGAGCRYRDDAPQPRRLRVLSESSLRKIHLPSRRPS